MISLPRMPNVVWVTPVGATVVAEVETEIALKENVLETVGEAALQARVSYFKTH